MAKQVLGQQHGYPAPLRQAGDANEDYQFDQHDIVEVLQTPQKIDAPDASFSNGELTGSGGDTSAGRAMQAEKESFGKHG